jgi:hypothetical protein
VKPRFPKLEPSVSKEKSCFAFSEARIARDAPRQSAATSYRCRRHQRAFRERAEGPARRARDSPDREKLGLSRIARERRSERASGRRRRSVGRRRAARVCPDGSCRFSRLCRSVVRRGAHGGNGRGDGHPRDGARAPSVAVYGRLPCRARGPHPQGAARLRTRVLSQRQSTRPTRPSGRARYPRRRASFPVAAPRGCVSEDARAGRAAPCGRPAGRQGRRRGLGILLWK